MFLLREMMQPGLLVMLSPLLAGYALGKNGNAGLLIGGMTSAVQMVIQHEHILLQEELEAASSICWRCARVTSAPIWPRKKPKNLMLCLSTRK